MCVGVWLLCKCVCEWRVRVRVQVRVRASAWRVARGACFKCDGMIKKQIMLLMCVCKIKLSHTVPVFLLSVTILLCDGIHEFPLESKIIDPWLCIGARIACNT